MKKSFIIRSLILCGIVLIAFSCIKKCDVDIEKPSDLKSIDWDGYNDVYTIFWNYFTTNCHGKGYPTGKTIKISGKISSFDYIRDYSTDSTYLHSFVLDDIHEYNDIFISEHLSRYNYTYPSIKVFCYSIADTLQKNLVSCDLTRIFYIKGELGTLILGGEEFGDCCFSVPCVYLTNIDDIYF